MILPLQCETLVAHCIDYRLQGFLNEWLEDNIPARGYDRVAMAGGVKEIFDVLRQVEIAVRLHNISRVVLINHEDCGAYGAEGTPERHKTDLSEAGRKVVTLFPALGVETYYLHLDGTFEIVRG